jgi:hypothetical protein
MKKAGWQGGANIFIISMEASLENALNIVVYHLYILTARQGEGAGFLAMLNDFSPDALLFINAVGVLTGDKEAKVILTDAFESEFKDMPAKLDEIDSLVRLVWAVGTDEYNLIMGRTRDRFYQGAYEQRLAALEGMATEMTTQGVPDGATAALAYRTLIKNRRLTQSTRMDKVGTDNTSINALRDRLTAKLNKNRGWLIFNYAEQADFQKQINAFFPLNLLGDRSVKGHYQLITPKADFRKICIHQFKEGEMVEIIVGAANVWISMADDATLPMPLNYKAIALSHVTVDPSVFGDLTKKYVMATNTDLTTSSDIIFNIIKAP